MSRCRLIIVVTCLLVLLILLTSFFGSSFFAAIARSVSHFMRPSNTISTENAQVGTKDWQIAPTHESTYQIQAYTSATSVAPRSRITFYVSTQDAGKYTIDVYRMGWYSGTGARLMVSIRGTIGENQGYYGISTRKLVCPDAKCSMPDRQTGLFMVHWDPSYTLTVPTNWTSGVYLAKFTDSADWQTYAPFDVLGNATSTYVLVTPDTTAEAYNPWGGASLYEEDDEYVPQYKGITISKGAGVQQVSFDRPYATEQGSGYVLVFELPTIRWLERQGYDLSYISSTDLDQNPAQLLRHKAFLSIGHDEYWTQAMRQGVENARDHGVGLAFLGANTAYWQMRFAPNSNDRIITCYKVLVINNSLTNPNDYTRDPAYGINNAIVTSQWRDPVLHNPESTMTGVMFSELTHTQAGFPWTVAADTSSPLFNNTGLVAGQSYGCGIVGYEWDRVWNLPTDPASYRAAVPKNIQIVSRSRVVPHEATRDGKPEYSNSAYYIASSGALVFASGAVYWGNALDDYRDVGSENQLYYQHQLENSCGGKMSNSKAVPEIQNLMANVMDALIVSYPSGHL